MKYERASSRLSFRSTSPFLAGSMWALAMALVSGGVQAATYTQGATDTWTPFVHSFDTSGNWSPTGGGSPSTGNFYINNGALGSAYATRTPTGGATFAGASLTMGAQASGTACAGGPCYGQLLLTSPGAVYEVARLILAGGHVNIATESASGNYTLAGGIEFATGTVNFIGDAHGAGKTLAIDSKITGDGSLVLTGAGSFTLSSAANDFTGVLTVGPSATLTLVTPGAVNNLSSFLTVQGTLLMNGISASVGGLQGPTGGKVQNNGANDVVLTLGGTVADRTFRGVIGGGSGTKGIALVKDGSYRQILAGANDYSLGTTINGGQLQISGINTAAARAGTGAIAIAGPTAGTLELDGTTNAVTVANSITLTGRASDAVAHIDNRALTDTISGTIGLLDGSTGGAENYTIVSTAGTLNVNGAIASTLATGTRILNLGGAGSGSIGGGVLGGIGMHAGANNILNKTGTGTWTLSSAVTGLDSVNVNGGTLTLANATFSVEGDATVASGATLQQSGAGSRLSGVTGDIVANGVLRLNGFGAAVNGLLGSGAGSFVENGVAGTATLTLGKDGIGEKIFSGIVRDGTVGSTLGLIKTGNNRQVLSGVNTFTGLATVQAGTLVVASNAALGSLGGATLVDGGTLELSGGVTSGEGITLKDTDSATANPRLLSTGSGDNTLSGLVTLADGNYVSTPSLPDYYNIVSAGAGLFAIGSVSSTALASGNRVLMLQGGGNGSVGSIAMGSGTDDTVEVADGGTWTLGGNLAGVDTLYATNGTLRVTADVSAPVSKLQTDSVGIIDADATQHLGIGDRIVGNGTMQGDYVIGNGAFVTVDNGTSSDHILSFTDALTFAGGSVLEITIDRNNPAMIDFLSVGGLLSLSDLAQVSFQILNGPLSAEAYVFASYDSWNNVEFAGYAPSGYEIDYEYGTLNNQIALVRLTTPSVPVPAPLALIGLGALAFAVVRRRVKR